MEKSFLAAAVQMHSGEDKAANLATATRLVEEAAAQGASLVVLPEFFNFLGHLETMVAEAECIPGPSYNAMSALAARLGITLVAGSICEQSAVPPGMGFNTSVIFAPSGMEIARYRKVHLFDAHVPGLVTFEESRWILPGEEVSVVETPHGKLGQAICYDVRFPELFRALSTRGMEVLAYPAAFASHTGQAHWDVLLRARAIENQTYVVAANQFGQHTANFATHGHSVIIDPWGEKLAEADTGEAVLVAEIKPDRIAEIRRNLPCLTHRKL